MLTRTVPGAACQTFTTMSSPQDARDTEDFAWITPVAASASITFTFDSCTARHTAPNTAGYSPA